jgi:hypothetical protein
MLHQCRQLRVLVTQREPLDARIERAFPLGPLPVPAPGTEDEAGLESVPSVHLLVRQVRQVQSEFDLTAANQAAVAALCRGVDGIPVALEALAPWFLVHKPQKLLQRLAVDPFSLVGRGDHRRPGLRELMCRAIDSLELEERRLLDELAVAGMSWSLSAAAELAQIPVADCMRVVRRLLRRGLVRSVEDAEGSRFVVLDLVRQLYSGRAARALVRSRA